VMRSLKLSISGTGPEPFPLAGLLFGDGGMAGQSRVRVPLLFLRLVPEAAAAGGRRHGGREVHCCGNEVTRQRRMGANNLLCREWRRAVVCVGVWRLKGVSQIAEDSNACSLADYGGECRVRISEDVDG